MKSNSKEKEDAEFKNIKFLLTSGMRTKILIALYDQDKNLDELRSELKKPSATILHGLKELESKNIIRKSKKYYSLTSNGYLLATNMIKLIDNWYAIDKNKVFWNNHDLDCIPESLLNKLYLLKDATYISSTTSDLSNAFNTYINLISESQELTIILPIYSENHFKHFIQLLNNNYLQKITLLVNSNILKSIRKSKFLKKSLLEHEKINIIETEEPLELFLTYSENFMSLTLFFRDGHYDDSQILIDESRWARKWASDLFDFYCQLGGNK